MKKLLCVILTLFPALIWAQTGIFEAKLSLGDSTQSSLNVADSPLANLKDAAYLKQQVFQKLKTYLEDEINKVTEYHQINEYRRTFESAYGSISDLINSREYPIDYFPDSLAQLSRIDTSKWVDEFEKLAVNELKKQENVGEALNLMNESKGELDDLESQFADPREQLSQMKNGSFNQISSIPESIKGKLIKDIRPLTGKKKRKFSSFSSGNAEANIKAHSLKDQPLRKRFTLSCDVHSQFGSDAFWDLKPAIGYKFNKDFKLLAGMSYRINVNANKGTLSTDQSVKGYRIFSDYRIWKSLFIRGEYESLNVKPGAGLTPSGTNTSSESYWSNAGLIGAGHRFSISEEIGANLTVQYNFLYSDESPYNRPLVVRVGLDI